MSDPLTLTLTPERLGALRAVVRSAMRDTSLWLIRFAKSVPEADLGAARAYLVQLQDLHALLEPEAA